MSEDQRKEKILAEFVALTGADEEGAKIFLAACEWKLQDATQSFYEEGEEEAQKNDGSDPVDYEKIVQEMLVNMLPQAPAAVAANAGDDKPEAKKAKTSVAFTPQNPFAGLVGKGHPSGSPVPATGDSTPTGSQSEDPKSAAETAARELVPLADGAPTTIYQFRLTNGTRLEARFNPAHTVNDLYRYLNIARPEYAAVNYVLATLHPDTELNDKSLTLESAKLLYPVLIQRIKK